MFWVALMDLGNINLRMPTSSASGDQGNAKGQKKSGEALAEGGFAGLIASLLSAARGEAKPAGEGGEAQATASPGPIDTEMHRPGRLEEAIKRFPFGRAGSPEEVADAVMFLISEKSSFTSGAVLNVSGAA